MAKNLPLLSPPKLTVWSQCSEQTPKKPLREVFNPSSSSPRAQAEMATLKPADARTIVVTKLGTHPC